MAHSGNEAARRVMTGDLGVREHCERGENSQFTAQGRLWRLICVPLGSAWCAADHSERQIKIQLLIEGLDGSVEMPQ